MKINNELSELLARVIMQEDVSIVINNRKQTLTEICEGGSAKP